jgi:hypothetical protein
MNAFLNLFRRNWGLKILALILSLVVYYSIRNSASNDNVSNNPFLKGASNGGNNK